MIRIESKLDMVGIWRSHSFECELHPSIISMLDNLRYECGCRLNTPAFDGMANYEGHRFFFSNIESMQNVMGPLFKSKDIMLAINKFFDVIECEMTKNSEPIFSDSKLQVALKEWKIVNRYELKEFIEED